MKTSNNSRAISNPMSTRNSQPKYPSISKSIAGSMVGTTKLAALAVAMIFFANAVQPQLAQAETAKAKTTETKKDEKTESIRREEKNDNCRYRNITRQYRS